MRTNWAMAGVAAWFVAVACGDDGGGGTPTGGTAGEAGDGADDGDGDDGAATVDDTGADDGTPGMCGDGIAENPIYPPPGDCYNNAMCDSCNCRTFRDNPPDPDARCIDEQGDAMVITATVYDFPGLAPLSGIEVKVINALSIVTAGPANAMAIAQATSNADGRIELSLADPPTDSIGIVAVVTADGFRDTATGLAKPPYEPSNAIHDLFVVQEAALMQWSDALGSDPALTSYLPLGDNGGVVGIARNRYTGEPVAGVSIVSLTSGDSTQAFVRYLQEDGTFGTGPTSATGIYVILNPMLAEEFEAELDGQIVSTRANRAGSGAPGVFTMNLSIDVDPGFDPFE